VQQRRALVSVYVCVCVTLRPAATPIPPPTRVRARTQQFQQRVTVSSRLIDELRLALCRWRLYKQPRVTDQRRPRAPATYGRRLPARRPTELTGNRSVSTERHASDLLLDPMEDINQVV